MKSKKVILKWLISIVMIIGFVCFFLFAPTWTHRNTSYEQGIYELKKVKVNEVFLQVMMRGTSKMNPVALFVSDGFDASLTYARKYEETLEQYVTMVHFDLRGTGRSQLGQWDDENSYLSMNVFDVLQLTTYLQREFKTDQVILIGHGTGSIIAKEALFQAPQNYSAYVGISQIGDLFENDLTVIEQLKQIDADSSEITALEDIVSKKEGFVLREFIEKYKPGSLLWNQTVNYWSAFLFQSEINGWDFLMSKNKTGKMWSLFYEAYLNDYNKIKEKQASNEERTTEISVPMYYVSGRYDYIVPTKASHSYFENIRAQKKEWMEFTASAHYPHIEEAELFASLIRDIIKKDIESTVEHE